jgi:hypothetical protein
MLARLIFNCEMFLSDPGNTSFGSVEGVGGWPGCDSREVELENKYHGLFSVVLCYVASINIQNVLTVTVICLIAIFCSVQPHYKHRFTLMLFFSRNVIFRTCN